MKKLEKVVFDGNDFGKKCFSFISGYGYKELDEAKLGMEIKIPVEDDCGNVVLIAFRVIRDVYFGDRQRWLHGKVLSEDEVYRQVEIKLYNDESRLNSMEVFPQAPPLSF